MQARRLLMLTARRELITNGDGSNGTAGWFGDADTAVTNASGRIRGTLTGTDNPRVIQTVIGLTVGRTYRLRMTPTTSTAASAIVRVSDTSDLGATGPYSTGHASGVAVDVTFVASQPTQYVGAILTSAVGATYVEVDDVSIRAV
jgi:hypothetical protein